jgi:hypothetical protein
MPKLLYLRTKNYLVQPSRLEGRWFASWACPPGKEDKHFFVAPLKDRILIGSLGNKPQRHVESLQGCWVFSQFLPSGLLTKHWIEDNLTLKNDHVLAHEGEN